MNLKITLDVPEEEAHLRVIRKIGRTLLEHHDCTAQEADDLELILGELCSNVIRHAQSKETHFLVTLEYFKPQVVITVTDAGEGFVPTDVLPVGTTRPDFGGGERLGGWGLTLLEGLSDKIDYTANVPHGTTVRVEKTLYYETEGAADEAAERDTEGGGVVTASKG